MSATRTQVYFTVEQRARIDRVIAARGITMAEFVREAVDEHLDDTLDPAPALAATFGTIPDAAAPGRDAWARG
jgi:predicted DNA-binding protein